MNPEIERPQVGLFVTCLVDFFRPNIGFAAIKLLEMANCDVEVPKAQTCCGQPAFNSGNRPDTQEIAKQVIATFSQYDYVVAPSGSCAGMLSKHYPELFRDDSQWSEKAVDFAGKVHELISFLVDVRGLNNVGGSYKGTVTYHDSCSGLRELGIKEQPRQLLRSLHGLELRELEECESCCGFGGTFSIKYPEISNAIVTRKTNDIGATNADLLLAGDLGCLLNMAGKLSRDGKRTKVRHIAEVLAGMTDTPPIGQKN